VVNRVVRTISKRKDANPALPKLYAFDVDETLEISSGPIKLADVRALKKQGVIAGICGNWPVLVKSVPNWQEFLCFLGPSGGEKHTFLAEVRMKIPASEYVMVGNIGGVSGASRDSEAARRAGWRFIKESDFAKGAR
jgi:hypothetical protein